MTPIVRTLWHGRFEDGPADELLAFTVSLPFDQRLAADDIAGSRAHVRGPGPGRHPVADDEADAVLAALDQVEDELAERHLRVRCRPTRTSTPRSSAGSPSWPGRPAPSSTPAGAATTRSPPTCGCTPSARLTAVAAAASTALQEVLLDRADRGRRRLPARATRTCSGPSRSLLAHHLLAHGWALGPRRRPAARLPARRADVSPARRRRAGRLVAAARPRGHRRRPRLRRRVREQPRRRVATATSWPRRCSTSPCSASTSRRIGEEVVLWSTEEFGFAHASTTPTPPAARCCPQKKNPDIAELARGKAGRLIGDLTGLLATLKGLPLAYNRDLQEDKEPLFDAVDQVPLALSAHRRAARHRRVRRATGCRRPPTPRTPRPPTWPSTSWRAGMPFRDAHAVVGGLVRDAIERRVPLADLVRGPPRPRRGGRGAARAGGGRHPAHDARRGRAGRGRPPAGPLPGGSGRGPAAHLRGIRGSGGGTPSSALRPAR